MENLTSSRTELAASAHTKTDGSGMSKTEQQSGVRGRHTCMRKVGSKVDLTKIIFDTTKVDMAKIKSDAVNVDLTKIKFDVANVVKENDKLVKEGQNVLVKEEDKVNSTENEDSDGVTVDTECDDSDDYSDYDSDMEDDEDEDEDEEVLRMLEDAKKLKILAQAFLHPEKPILSDHSVFGRNYFDRPSAVEYESKEEADEHAQILADA